MIFIFYFLQFTSRPCACVSFSSASGGTPPSRTLPHVAITNSAGWQLCTSLPKRQLGYHLLTRGEQVKMVRLRTGHNRLNHHLHTKSGTGQTGECPCNMGQQAADHTLQTCPTYAAARDNMWPSPTSLEKKLYGSQGDLWATAAFIRERLGWTSEPGRRRRRRRRRSFTKLLCCEESCSFLTQVMHV